MGFVVKVVGCSTAWSNRPTSSYCIDNEILVDCGEGTTKYYDLCKVDFLKIKNIFITHFHSDHYLGLAEYLAHMCFYNKKSKYLTIYGPKGLKRHLNILKSVSFGEVDAKKINLEDYINIVELSGEMTFEIGEYIVTTFETSHGNLKNMAYIFEKGDLFIGFSGDCTYSKKLEEFASKSNICFLECCDEITTKFHLGYDKFLEIKNKYNKNRYLAVHCNDSLYKKPDYDIEFAISSKIYHFN